MKIQYGDDIRLPERIPSMLELVHEEYGEITGIEQNPWIVRAAAIAYLIGAGR
jgi:hypothetical protein